MWGFFFSQPAVSSAAPRAGSPSSTKHRAEKHPQLHSFVQERKSADTAAGKLRHIADLSCVFSSEAKLHTSTNLISMSMTPRIIFSRQMSPLEAKPRGPHCYRCLMREAGTHVPHSPSAGTGPSLVPIVQDGHMELHVFPKPGEGVAAGDNVGALRRCKSHKQPHRAAVMELLKHRSINTYAIT